MGTDTLYGGLIIYCERNSIKVKFSDRNDVNEGQIGKKRDQGCRLPAQNDGDRRGFL